MATTYNEMPFGECPYCGHTWQMDDYYDIEDGDSWACPKCEREFEIVNVDHSITATFVAVSQQAAQEAKGPTP